MRGRIDDVAHLKTIADVRHKRAVYGNDLVSLVLVEIAQRVVEKKFLYINLI